jgi:hypothetical protein
VQLVHWWLLVDSGPKILVIYEAACSPTLSFMGGVGKKIVTKTWM